VDNLITPGVRSLECFQDHLKQFCNEWLLEGNNVLSETGKIGKPNASLVWGSSHHCGTPNQEWQWTDLKRATYPTYRMSLMMVCYRMAPKTLYMVAASARKTKAVTVKWQFHEWRSWRV